MSARRFRERGSRWRESQNRERQAMLPSPTLAVIGPDATALARFAALPMVLASVVAGCSSHGNGAPGSSGPIADGGAPEAADDAGDYGSVSTTYPAFTVDMPHVLANQGVVLGSPVIVTVTWPADDSNSATWDGFGDAIGGSSYWSATTSEYGVSAATSGPANHVHMVQPLPKTMSYFDLQNFVLLSLGGTLPDAGPPEGGADAGSDDAGPPEGGADAGNDDAGVNPPWPAPTNPDGGDDIQIIYGVFVPVSTAVTEPGTGRSFCDLGGLGYHDSVSVGGKLVAYSVTLECASQTLPELEESAAHEYTEGATNPYIESMNQLGYTGLDPDHVGWSLYTGAFGNEIGDVCQTWADSYYKESSKSFPYWVQRDWSNSQAAAGHAPCVPAPSGAYYGMTLFPSQESSLSLDMSMAGMGPMTTRGFHAPVGQPVTFQVGFYSDAPADPWTIAYDFPKSIGLFDFFGRPISNGTATVTIDKTSGQNGEKAYVTVTPTKAGQLGFQRMAMTWDLPAGDARAAGILPHYQPLILLNK
jgi:hypothetical protein